MVDAVVVPAGAMDSRKGIRILNPRRGGYIETGPGGRQSVITTPDEEGSAAIQSAKEEGYRTGLAVRQTRRPLAGRPVNTFPERITRSTFFGGRETATGNAPTFKERRLAMKIAKKQSKAAAKQNKLTVARMKREAKREKFDLKSAKQQAVQQKLLSKQSKITYKNFKLQARLDAIKLKQDIKAAKADQREMDKALAVDAKKKRELEREAARRKSRNQPSFFAKLSRFVKPTYRKSKRGPRFVKGHYARRRIKVA